MIEYAALSNRASKRNQDAYNSISRAMQIASELHDGIMDTSPENRAARKVLRDLMKRLLPPSKP